MGAPGNRGKVRACPPDLSLPAVHALSPGNVQKNLNKGAAEGYRLFPHTLAALGAFAVIMEKTAGAD